jgi:hypothetical protein
MFAERQYNTDPIPHRLGVMQRLLELGRWLAAPAPEPPQDDSADWYTGLAGDARGFSDQLRKLQYSLRRAGNPEAHREMMHDAVETIEVAKTQRD